MQPPTSKLNPNAPDFMRPPMTTTASTIRPSPMLNKNNNSSSSNFSNFSNTRFNNSNNLPNILTNQGINAYLQTQTNNAFDLSTLDTNIFAGKSIKELNDIITAGNISGNNVGSGNIGGNIGSGNIGTVNTMSQPPPPPPITPQQHQHPYPYYEPKGTDHTCEQ